MSKMLKSSGAMAAATMTSRMLGMVREMVYAGFMGNSAVASAFTLAFQVPNLFRRLLGEGALTAAFIPLFKEKEVTEGPKAMWRAANAVICGLTLAAAAVTVVVVLAISSILLFRNLSAETRLMLELMRLMFPYMLLVCLAAVLIGMANAKGHFFIPSLGAAVLNVVMIGSVIFLAPRMGSTLDTQIFALAIGVVLAGAAQAFFQLPTLAREGYAFEWVSPWKDPTVREVAVKMLPGSIGVAAFQINVLLTQTFSFWFDTTIVSTFNSSVRLMELPQGMFGISLATYLLPTLSGLASEKKYPEFRQTLEQGLSTLSFANLFAAAMCMALSVPIVRLIFERGAFTPEATYRVAMALVCLGPGLLMFSMNNILARAFFALKDIQTPMKISVVCLVLNLVFAFWMVQRSREAGLAAANSLSAAINLGLLLYALRRKLAHLDTATLKSTLVVLLPASVAAGIVAALLASLLEARLGHATVLTRICAVFIPAGVAGALYAGIAIRFKVGAATEMFQLITSKLRRAR